MNSFPITIPIGARFHMSYKTAFASYDGIFIRNGLSSYIPAGFTGNPLYRYHEGFDISEVPEGTVLTLLPSQ